MRKMKKTWLLACLVCAFASAACLGIFAAAEQPAESGWTDGLSYNPEYAYGGGSGTAPDPYLLSAPEHLAMLAVNQNFAENISANYSQGKYFKLTADIDLSGKNWTPIGDKVGADRNNVFYGAMDFAGHRVTGIEHTGYDGQFFGFMGTFSIGWIRNPDISFGDVNVNFTAGEESVRDQTGLTSVACYGGVAGLMIGGTIGYDEGDVAVRVAYEGKTTFRSSAAGQRVYAGGVVGFAMSGTIGNTGKDGETEVSVEIGARGGLAAEHTGSTNDDMLYMGGIVGNGYSDPVVGKRNGENDEDVRISFVNRNAEANEYGLHAKAHAIRMGGIAGSASFTVGNAGGGAGQVTVTVENRGTMLSECTATQESFSGYIHYVSAMFGEAGGLVGTKGTGAVEISVLNGGEILARHGYYSRVGGIVGMVTEAAVVGIDNAQSESDVRILFRNLPGAAVNNDDAYDESALLFSYLYGGSLVGTKGTGTLSYVSMFEQSSLTNAERNVRRPFVWGGDGLLGSLNGGEAVDFDKTFGYALMDAGGAGYGKYNDSEVFLDYHEKIVEVEHAVWMPDSANADGVSMSVIPASGYAFGGWEDGTTAETGASGRAVVLFDGTNALPAPVLISLDAIEVDFSAQTYTGGELAPKAEGYVVKCFDETGARVSAVMPGDYRVKTAELYRNDVCIGVKRYDAAQIFTVNKAANAAEVPASVLTFDPNAETYALDAVYEISAREDFGAKLAQSGSLTAYKGDTLYIRAKETETHLASAATAVPVTAYALTLPEQTGFRIVTADERTTFLANAYYGFAVTLSQDYEAKNLTVKAGGETLEPDAEGVYRFMITADTAITVTGVSPVIWHSVTLTAGEGLTLVPVTAGQDRVRDGQSFSFTVEKSAGFEGEVIVRIDGEVAEAEDGVYTARAVSGDLTVTAEKKAAEPPVEKPAEKKGCGKSAKAGAAGIAAALVLAVGLLVRKKSGM